MIANASIEQMNIIDAIKTNNVKVNSVAGSGKTTTVLHMSQILDNESILLLTYNARLKLETRNKKKQLQLNNLDVDSYHSFCVGHYNNKCFKDSVIIKLLKENTKPIKKINYSIIVIDEAQDMNKLYYKLVNKIINDNIKDCRICIIGDRYQCIYQFKSADFRFITLADKIFKPNELEWKELKLSTSFRITNQMADFINHCVMGFNYINAQKNGNKVRYIMTETFDFQRPIEEVLYYLNDCHYDDIFILAPSVKKGKNDSPVRVLANALTKCNIPIHVPTDDDERLDEDIIKNKVVFSTFHQVKGLERKNVIVYGFDESYFQIFNKDADPNVCPNELYVAITRGSENLTIFHNTQKNYVPFLNEELLEKYTYYERNRLRTVYDGGKTITLDVSEITKHMPSEIVNKALDYFEKIEINKKEKFINIPIKTKQGNLHEYVAEINGILIPSYFEYVNNNKMTIYDILMNKNLSIDIKLSMDMPTSDLLKLATIYSAFSSGYFYKIKQIQNYDWMEDEKLDDAVDRLDLVINKNARFEIEVSNPELKIGKVIVGRMDCMDGDTIWEFKCTKELDSDHFIQLAIYALLNENMREAKIRDLDKRITQIESDMNKKEELEKVFFKKIELGNILLINNIKYVVYHIDENGIKIQDSNKNKRLIRESSSLLPRIVKKGNIAELNKVKENKIFLEKCNFKYKLMNILTNEIYEIKFEKDKLDEMVNYLLYHKYKGVKKFTDDEFINDLLNQEINIEELIDINENIQTNAFLD
jgi:DNA polymerase III delta prime subunit